MPGLRVKFRFAAAALGIVCATLPAAVPGQPPPDTARPRSGFAETLRNADSAAHAAQDTLLARTDRPDSVADTAKLVRKVYRWTTPYAASVPCPAALEGASDCWRRDSRLAVQSTGFPAARQWTLSLTRMEPAPLESPFFPAVRNSPYGEGGLLPPDQYARKRIGSDVIALEDVWTPVIPLDTPVTTVGWERGALTLNMFRLKLRRMLSESAYLGLDFYSATADSQDYDYQFNVHQPYLSGWGFLGKIYPPIDRDSASLVISGITPALDAVDFRPRVGFWLDTASVFEVFLDRVRNHSQLAWPRLPGAPPESGPADSVQASMPSTLSAWTGGAVLAHGGRGWSSQLEAAGTALEMVTRRVDDTSSGTGGNGTPVDQWEGVVQRLRGRVSAPGFPASPWLEAEARNEIWRGDLYLHGAGRGAADEGWLDAQSVTFGIRPGFRGLVFDGQAGLGRMSRMDGGVSWLPRLGAAAELDLSSTRHVGLRAEAGAGYERRDPDWEYLYRHNPALFRYPSPDLDPRSDLDLRGSLGLELPFVRLGGGAGYAVSEGAWLPYVLPSPDACADLADAIYGYAGGAACDGDKLADSQALRLRNWDRLQRLDWHLSLGLSLGNWSLDLRNQFLLAALAEDDAVRADLDNRMLPARVFKGRLGWERLLVDGKLLATVGWGWEWFSTRYAWVPDLQGKSSLRKLDEYLALDFRASMKIRSFLLYFKGMNFNHDRYATEPGVHPPGVNFRYGIEWTLWN